MMFIRKKKVLRMVEGVKNYHHELYKMYRRQSVEVYESDRELSDKLRDNSKQHFKSFLEWNSFYEQILND